MVGAPGVCIMPKSWSKKLAPYRVANNRRALYELALTASAFAASWILSYMLFLLYPYLSVLLVLPTAGLLVRLFMLQHDCGHLSMFSSKPANDWVGRALGVVTLTPYDYWRHAHAMHHASVGNLDKRGMGDIETLTVAEYAALDARGKLLYRLYRNPFVLFVIGPIYLFILRHRLPTGAFKQGPASWLSVMGTNAALLVASALLIYWMGVVPFLAVHLPIVSLGAAIGVWLFYVQHQFDETHWSRPPEWSHEDAAMNGSSYYDLPQPLRWFTGNIGIHHLHHLSSRIPFYRLPKVLKDFPELKDKGRITLWQSIKCVNLTLWDEGARKLVSFAQARAILKSTQVA